MAPKDSPDHLWPMDRFTLFEPIYRRCVVGTSWSESVVEWAVDLLGKGTDGPSLRILAGLARGSYEAEVNQYFAETLAQLNESAISDVERVLGEARAVASAIVRREVSPMDGVGTIHSRAVGPLNHPSLLQPWCDLDGGFRRREGTENVEMLEGDALEDAITAFAAEFLAVEPDEQLQLLEADLRPAAT